MDYVSVLLGTLLVFASLFLIMIVLVQRGRGGGLTGALGGLGGQSAFGSKAGDVFTRITIGAASVWILLCVLTVKLVGGGADPLDDFKVNKKPGVTETDTNFGPSRTGTDTKTGAGAKTSTDTSAPAGSTSDGTGGSTPTDGAAKQEAPTQE